MQRVGRRWACRRLTRSGKRSSSLSDLKLTGAVVEQHHDIAHAPAGVDVVYATRWQTMGVPKADPQWKEKFKPFSVTEPLMSRVSKPSGTIFLHDLPAVRGDDVTDAVLDGPQSLAFRQAEHKMTSAMAVLTWCLNGTAH